MTQQLPLISRLALAAIAITTPLHADTGLITTVAGGGTGSVGGPAASMALSSPEAVALDANGNLFIGEHGKWRIVRVDAVTGIATVVTGNGQSGYSGDGGLAIYAGVSYPGPMVLDPAGNLYFSDTFSNRVRRIDAQSGIITTFVGNGNAASSGDGGPASAASVNNPEGLYLDQRGNLFIAESYRVRRVDAVTGIITTVAGTGTGGVTQDGTPALSTSLNPDAVVVDPNGNLFISDDETCSIRRVDAVSGLVSTVVGMGPALACPVYSGDGAPGTSTGIGPPSAIGMDSTGNLFIVSPAYGRVLKLDALTHLIYTVAGDGAQSSQGDQGPATSASLNLPDWLAVASNGNLFVSETWGGRIRRVYLPSPLLYTATSVSSSISGQTVTLTTTVRPIGVSGTPNGSVSFFDTSAFPPAWLGSAQLNSGTASFATTTLATGTHNITASYAGDGTFSSSTSIGIPVTVAPTSLIPTTVSLISLANPSPQNAAVVFVAQVTTSGSGSSSYAPSGILDLLDGGTVITSASLTPSSTQIGARFSTLGNHSITVYYHGDANYAASTSPVVIQTVKATPTLSIVSDTNPSQFGGTVNFTATIAQSTATGTITFTDQPSLSASPATLATLPLANAAATFSTNSLTPGTHYIMANYSGDANFMRTGYSYVTQVVKIPTSATISSAQNPAYPSQNITVSYQVSPGSPTSLVPTGSVQLVDGSTSLASAALSGASGQFTIAFPAAGTHSLTLVYSGDENFNGVTSAALSQSVKNLSTPTISADINPVTAGATVTFTCTILQSTATGTVTFLDYPTPSSNPITLGTVSLTNARAVFAISTLSVGTHNIVAGYNGDATYLSGSSSLLPETVRAVTATTVSATSNTAIYGQAVVFNAQVSPTAATGTVQFMDGSTSLGTANVTGGASSLSTSSLTAGVHSITAIYSGDSVNAGSASVVWTETINKITTTTTLTSSANPSNYGQSVTLTATVSPATATGNVQFMDGSTSLGTATLTNGTASLATSSLTAGTHPITAVYSGDASNGASTSAAVSETINKIATTATLTSSSNPSANGQSVTLTANVSPATATGTIQFMDGATSIGTAALASGTASLASSGLTVGSHAIAVVYSGDANNLTSTSSVVTQVVNTTASGTTLQSSAAGITYGQPVQLTATVSPTRATGTVQFLDGGSSLGTATLASGSAALTLSTLPAGAHTITAVYGGDANDAGSTSSAVTITVSQVATSMSVASSLNPSVSGQAVTFAATISPAATAGSVQFFDGSTVLGTVTLTNGTASFSSSSLAVAAHTIKASYSGGGNYAASSATLSQVVNASAPGAPSSLAATASSASQINLTWTASPSSGVTYNVYSSTTAGFTPSASNRIASGVVTTSYSNTGLAASTTYYYVVKAQNSAGESAGTNQASATTQSSGGGCHVVYNITTQWNVGFGTAITIQNTGTKAINGWNLSWTWAGNQQITQSWNSNYSQNGMAASLTNASWNPSIAPGATISGMGFNGSYSGTNPSPTAFYLNGVLCH